MAYFDEAQSGKGEGNPFNPNDHMEYPEAFSAVAPPNHGRPSRTGSTPEASNTKDDLPHRNAMAQEPSAESPYRHREGRPNAAGTHRKASRISGGYDRSVENSPLHHHSATRSKPRGDETPENGSAVPKFGEWNQDPSSADSYTQIFSRAREEKQTGSATIANDAIFLNSFNHDSKHESSSCSCFGWCKK